MNWIRNLIKAAVSAVVKGCEAVSGAVGRFLHRPKVSRVVATVMVFEGTFRTVALTAAGIYVLATGAGIIAVITGLSLVISPWMESVLRFNAADSFYQGQVAA